MRKERMMAYSKSDGPFGLLPKKKATDHEWATSRTLVPMASDDLVSSSPSAGREAPEAEPAKEQPVWVDLV